MTLDELRDWHFAREGWSWREDRDGEPYWESRTGKVSYYDPFPATLDAADASFPKGWDWRRDLGTWYGIKDKGANQDEVAVADNGNKIRELYELSMLAWQKEAAAA